MLTPIAILESYERHGWGEGNDPMAQTLQLARDTPEALGDLVMEALGRSLKHHTFLHAALDLMDDDTYVKTVSEAWRQAAQGQVTDFMLDMLDRASLQYPQVFAGAWDRFFALQCARARGPSHSSRMAWRALDNDTILAWRHRLDEQISAGAVDRELAIALLYSRQPEAVFHVWRLVPAYQGWLMDVGYVAEAGAGKSHALKTLHTDIPLHIGFGGELRVRMLAEQPGWRREIHRRQRSWQAEPQVGHARLGGSLTSNCGLCHQPLHRLLALSQPALAGMDSESAIEFATCLSCLGWESDGALFYRHDADGRPHAHPTQQSVAPQVPQQQEGALLEGEVILFQAPSRWHWQDWGESNGRQNMHRLGGPPCWVQSAQYPDCPDCHQTMRFVMQLDSGLPLADGVEWLWGSGGCNYSFWCAGCRVSGHLWQCT